MSDSTLRKIAITFALATYAIARLLVQQLQAVPTWATYFLPGQSHVLPNMYAQVFSAAVAAIQLGLLIAIYEIAFYRYFARNFIGTWIYKSSTGGFGVANISVTGFWVGGTALSYEVALVKSADEAIALVKGMLPIVPYGTAKSFLIGLKDNELRIAYQVAIGEEPVEKSLTATKGLLVLSAVSKTRFLKGVWESTKKNFEKKEEEKRRKGDLDFFHLADFEKKFKAASLTSL
jgi:hypothetical protein